MEPLKLRKHNKPEWELQKQWIPYVQARGWFVRELHGGAKNHGWPDLRMAHPAFGTRWVEIKLPNMKGSKFTKQQEIWFPQMHKSGDYIWIITAVNQYNYDLLFKRPRGNFLDYFGAH